MAPETLRYGFLGAVGAVLAAAAGILAVIGQITYSVGLVAAIGVMLIAYAAGGYDASARWRVWVRNAFGTAAPAVEARIAYTMRDRARSRLREATHDDWIEPLATVSRRDLEHGRRIEREQQGISMQPRNDAS